MQEEIRRYSDKLRADGRQPIQARVGVNTGEVVVRSIKHRRGHAEYTPIGHTTNLAARMQTLAPIGSIAVSESTRKLVRRLLPAQGAGADARQRRQRAGQRLRGDGAGAAAHAAAALRRRGLHEVRRARARDGGDEGTRRNWPRRVTGRSSRRWRRRGSASRGCSSSSRRSRSRAGWCWRPFRSRTARPRPTCRSSTCCTVLQDRGEDDPRARREKVTGKVLTLDRSLEDTLPYLFALLGIAEGIDPLAQMDAQISKRRTLDAIKRILLRESLNQPLMVIFEDLHWIDDADAGAAESAGRLLGTARILCW